MTDFLARSTFRETFCRCAGIPKRQCEELVAMMQYKASGLKHTAVVVGFRFTYDAVFGEVGT